MEMPNKRSFSIRYGRIRSQSAAVRRAEYTAVELFRHDEPVGVAQVDGATRGQRK